MALPVWTRVAAVAGAAVIVLGGVSIPVAAVAAGERDRQLALEIAVQEAAAARDAAAKAAEALAEAKDDAARLNAEYAGLTVSLGAAVHPDTAAAFEAARVKLAFAISDGELEELSAAVAEVTEAFTQLAASADGQAEALISASPLAGASRDALTQAVAELATADDVAAALALVKNASDAVVAAQKAGVAAAKAAAKQEAAEADADTGAWDGGVSSGGGPSSGSGWAGHLEDPGIIGMEPGPRGSCGENPTGQVVTLPFSWQAREGNTVAISYAYTDGDYRATGGFILLASGLGSSGTVSIPVTCPVGPGPISLVTVEAVASNSNGSAAAYYWGL
ncbi:chemotaxis protein histidine kinase CheA [Agromyces flavus]|nr:hypothetical protein [Agromyces flavus]MCP2366241.1 chemotaxis protein histidine kinase CheA [Agromyces flavus]GGI44280.1 hypothetical protein GCM10010932_03820 [Agromyces flavus]